jgi:hypothetical protein
METHADKSQENKSHVAAGISSQHLSNGESAFQFADNRPEAIAQRKMQEAINSSPQMQQLKAYQGIANNGPLADPLKAYHASSDNYTTQTVQRLAMKYGDSPPIPEDAKKIADAQNTTRGQDIDFQTIPGAVPDNVYDVMAPNEKIFIVAHGRAPLGSEPAILQDGTGGTLSGSEVAAVINNLKTGLKGKGKSIGTVKIEACMSALSRKTESGFFGETFVKAKPSLLTDISASLANTYKVDDIAVQGNLGFSTGNEFESGGVTNISPKNTEVGLLASVLETLYSVSTEDWNTKPNIALKKDGSNIVKKYGTALTDFDRGSKISELISTSTAELVNSYLASNPKSAKLNDDIINLVSLLNGYVRQNHD